MKIEIELKIEQAAPWWTGNWLQTHVGAMGCLSWMLPTRFVVFRFKYSNIKSLCWLPCSRLHSNTQFEAKVRELLKDRLDLESRPIFSRISCLLLCSSCDHACFRCLLLLIKIDVSNRLITLGDLFVFDLSRHSNCVPSCRLWITLFVGKPSLGSVTTN